MEPIVGFQQPIAGIFVKLVVDALRYAFPSIQKRWVHLVTLALSLGVAALLQRSGLELYLQEVVTIFLAAIGVNEVTSRMKPSEEVVEGD